MTERGHLPALVLAGKMPMLHDFQRARCPRPVICPGFSLLAIQL